MLHHGGRAVLRGGDAGDARLSDELRAACKEWAEVVDVVLGSGNAHELDLLRRRGRQLAARVAAVLGRPVEFVDPVSGEAESISADPGPFGRHETNGAVDAPPVTDVASGDDLRAAGVRDTPSPWAPLGPEPPGPTPWATGAAVATFFAVLVALADVVLAHAFAGTFGLLWVPANLLVTAGTGPSLWIAREVPFWRWPALGAAVGLGCAWVVMLLGLLGS